MKTFNKYSKTITQDETQPAAQSHALCHRINGRRFAKPQVGIVSMGYMKEILAICISILAKEVKAGVEQGKFSRFDIQYHWRK